MKPTWSIIRAFAGYVPMLVSLLLCALVIGFWVRSYQTGDAYRRVRQSQDDSDRIVRDLRVATGQGAVGVQIEVVIASDPAVANAFEQSMLANQRAGRVGYRSFPTPGYPLRNLRRDTVLGSLGFHYQSQEEGDESRGFMRWGMAIGVPLWSLLLLTGAYPAGRYVMSVVQRQREERIALGLCPTCGMAIRETDTRCTGCDRKVTPLRHAETGEPA